MEFTTYHICYFSDKKLYKAFYHGSPCFWSKDIEKLKKRIKKADKDFKKWYKEGNIHNNF